MPRSPADIPRNFETAEQISRGAAQLALYDLPDDYFSTFVPKVLAVDEAAVTRVAAQHIDPARLVTVIVGDRDKVAPALGRAEPGSAAEVCPSDLTARSAELAAGTGPAGVPSN